MNKITVIYISHWVFEGTTSEEAIEDTIGFDDIASYNKWLGIWDNRVIKEIWNYA